MENLIVKSVGVVKINNNKYTIQLDKKYLKALEGLNGFGYVQVVWWFSECDNEQFRQKLTESSPYKNGPSTVGVFASRSPNRPNPIALTCAHVQRIDYVDGIIKLNFIDAIDGSPVLDIKPYTPSFDRVENPSVPVWCENWPKCNEDSSTFDWQQVFNF